MVDNYRLLDRYARQQPDGSYRVGDVTLRNMPPDAPAKTQIITASADEAQQLKAAGVLPRAIAVEDDLAPAQASKDAPEADPAGGRGNQAQQSGTSPPEKRAAIQPLLDRVRPSDCWFVQKGQAPQHRAGVPITDALITNHLSGAGVGVGACPMRQGSSTTRIALLDLDDHDKQMQWSEVVKIARDLADQGGLYGIRFTAFRSSGGRGMHLYAIWGEPQEARDVRTHLGAVLKDCGYANGTKGLQAKRIEIFPKQDEIPADGWGNMFVLPGSRESAPVDLATGEVIGWGGVAWATSDPVPAAPIVERAVVTVEPGSADGERIRSALAAIDPNELDYDQWIRMVMAVSHGTNGSAEGHALIHEWSSRFSRYDPVETDKQWGWAKPNKPGGITVMRLIREAEKRGWVDPERTSWCENIEEQEQEQVQGRSIGQGIADAMLLDDVPPEKIVERVGVLEPAGREAALVEIEVHYPEVAREARGLLARVGALAGMPARDIGAEMNDAGNVAVLVHQQRGNLRYDPSTETFIFWINNRWERDEDGTRMRQAIKQVASYWDALSERTRAGVAAAAAAEANAVPGAGRKRADGFIPGGKAASLDDLADKQAGWAKACGNVKQINAIVALAKVEKDIVVDTAMLDRNPHLLGCENGIIDLRTGKLHADARDEFVTRRVPVRFDPRAKAPRWMQFQDEIAGQPAGRAEDGSHPYTPRPDLVAFKQRWAGSMLVGENVGQKFFTATGEGSNGKSLELETYVSILGPLAVKLPQGAFMAGTRGPRDADAASPMLSSLRGVRLALASETDAGHKLNTGDVKAVTGDDEITARRLYGNSERFRLEATVVLLTNHPPTIQTVDNAISGRLMIVPYERTWNRPDDVGHDPERPDADPGLKAALRAEQEGILAWMVAGAVQVLANGGRLDPPREITEKTDRYLQQQSVFGQWFESLEVVGTGSEDDAKVGGTPAKDLYDDFKRFTHTTGRSAPEAETMRAFGAAMQKVCGRRGVGKSKGRDVTRYALRKSAGNSPEPTFDDLF